MTDEPIRSRPYSTAAACERCVFRRGFHADWCDCGVYDGLLLTVQGSKLFPPDVAQKRHRVARIRQWQRSSGKPDAMPPINLKAFSVSRDENGQRVFR